MKCDDLSIWEAFFCCLGEAQYTALRTAPLLPCVSLKLIHTLSHYLQNGYDNLQCKPFIIKAVEFL